MKVMMATISTWNQLRLSCKSRLESVALYANDMCSAYSSESAAASFLAALPSRSKFMATEKTNIIRLR